MENLQKYFPRLFPFSKAPKRDGKKKKKRKKERSKKSATRRRGRGGDWEMGALAGARGDSWEKWGEEGVPKGNFFGFVEKPQQFLSATCKTSSDFHVYN